MEECPTKSFNSEKRARDDSDCNSPESKRVNAITDPDPNQPESDRVNPDIKPDSHESNKNQHDSEDNLTESNGVESEFDPPDMMKFREDILDILDEPEIVSEIHDLDSVIRSFEEEIIQSSPSHTQRLTKPASNSGELQPDLGYLLEASDDELGLTSSVSEAQTQNQHISIPIGNEEAVKDSGNIVGFENEWPSYDSFELELGDRVIDGNYFGANGNGDFVTVDGLFDYSDFGWPPESLHAL